MCSYFFFFFGKFQKIDNKEFLFRKEPVQKNCLAGSIEPAKLQTRKKYREVLEFASILRPFFRSQRCSTTESVTSFRKIRKRSKCDLSSCLTLELGYIVF